MKLKFALLALTMVLPLCAQAADGVSYSSIEGGYTEARALGVDADGYYLKGSVAFDEAFYGFAAFDLIDESDVDVTEQTLGMGFHRATSANADFFAELGYVRNDLDAGSLGDYNDNGYRAGAGFRGNLAPKFEGSVKATYANVGDFGKGFGASLGALYKFSPTWGVSLGYAYEDRSDSNLNRWNVGVRATF